MSNITNILKKYIAENIPQKATNAFYQLFTAVDVLFDMLNNKMSVLKRERNFLTAQSIVSLRSLASKNGFEPKLKTPAKGLLRIKIYPKLYNRVGFPLYLPPYSVFVDKISKVQYYYNSNKLIKLDDNEILIPVVEGSIKTINHTCTGTFLESFYLDDENIADGSIFIDGYTEVKSFVDNEGLNDNKLFVVKFSNNPQKPLIIYIKGTEYNQNLNISYKLTLGEYGNISETHNFETSDIIDSHNESISASDTEIEITNVNGFDFGSNGTTENALRSAIGYNHSQILLFDNVSYTNFLTKYSSIFLQKIINNPGSFTINNIYLIKKIMLLESNYISNEYKKIVSTKSFLFSETEKINLSAILKEYEFSLSSHTLNDPIVNKYGFQLMFNSVNDKNQYAELIIKTLYFEFSKFLYKRNYSINLELLFNNFPVNVDYIVFDEFIENQKLSNKSVSNSTIINNSDYLPLICGDFNICDYDFKPVKLFFDINVTVK